jgi:beta-alanine--pyruvate transaminase
LAAIDLLEREDAPARVRALAPVLEAAVHQLRGAPHVSDIRNIGLAAGITLAHYPGEPARRPFEVAMACWRKGFYVRFGVDTVQLAPPFVSTPAQIDALVSALGDALHEAATA